MMSKCCVAILVFTIFVQKVCGDGTTDISNELNIQTARQPTKVEKNTESINDAVSDGLEVVLEKFRQEMNEQIKVIRNATMFLLTAISARANECQGIRDSASKIRILHSALALQDPDIKINIPEDYVQTKEEILEFDEEFETPLPDKLDEIQQTTILSSAPTTPTTTTVRAPSSPKMRKTTKQMPCGYNLPGENHIDCPPPLALPAGETETLEETTTRKENKYYITKPTTIERNGMVSRPDIKGFYADTSTHSSDRFMEVQGRETSAIRSSFRCPEAGKRVAHECFSLHLDKQMNWTNARSFCRSRGGDLAEPDLQNDRLPRLLLKAWPSLRESEYWTLWVGATDLEMEGVWHWVTGGILDLKSSSRWDLVEPPDEGETQDCLAMILWVPGRWRRWDLLDDPCELEWIVFCEYSPIYNARIT